MSRSSFYAEQGTLRYSKIQIGILLTGLSVFAQLYLFQPLLDRLAHHFSLPSTSASLAVSLGTVGMAIGLFFYVFRADSIPRKRLMVNSLFASSILTLLTPYATTFPLLLLLCFLRGLALSGVSAVAIAYLAEEITPAAIGLAIAFYLSGNTLGGMLGRVFATLLAGWYSWQVAAFAIGGMSLLLAIAFTVVFPKSCNFTPTNLPIRTRLKRMRLYLTTPYFLVLYAVGFVTMGTFVSLYNYISFLLEAPPFSFPHYVIALIFLMYVVGIGGSLLFGRLSDRHSQLSLLRYSLALSALGLLFMAVKTLLTITLGLGCFTFAFFAAHTVASRMVSTRAGAGKSSATCLYWLFYYIGSSTAGYLTGLVYFSYGWGAFLAVNFAMLLVAFLLAQRFLQPAYTPTDNFHVPS